MIETNGTDDAVLIKEGTLCSWTSKVRDYEMDAYGGVNAATYLNYMEEARKEYLALLKFDLAELAKKNIGFVVIRYEVDYRCSLIAGDHFVVETSMERVSRIKVIFHQSIYRLPDRKPAVSCQNSGIPINIKRNRPEWPPELDILLKDFPIRGD